MPRLDSGPISRRAGRLGRWLGAAAGLALAGTSVLIPATSFAASMLTSSPSGSIAVAQAVQFTASYYQLASPTTPIISGTVTFFDTTTQQTLCTNVFLSNGVAQCGPTTNLTTAGTHTISATLNGGNPQPDNPILYLQLNVGVGGSTGTVTVTITAPSASTTLTSGVSTTFSALVSGAGTPTGTVTFTEISPYPSSSPICTAVVAGGSATCPGIVPIAGAVGIGTTIMATYTGNLGTGSTTLTFGGTGTSTTGPLTVSGSPNPSSPNQSVTITGTTTTVGTTQQCFNGVSYYPCSGTTTTGYMWFLDPTVTQPICPPNTVAASTTGTTGTCSYSFAVAGPHTVTAYFCTTFPNTSNSGFTTIYQCTSGQTTGTYTQTVNNTVNSTTTLTANPTSTTAGQNVTFSATVSGSGGTPTGSVAVQENGLTRCTITLASGSGTCQSALSEGTHNLTGSYSGDTAFLSSTSPPVTITATAGAAASAPAAATEGGPPSLPASLVPPPNTNIAAIRTSLAILADIPTADVTFSYFGPSAVVSQLIRPPLATMPFVVGCYSGPNATADEQAASVLFGTKPAGSQFIIFFIRGTRGYSFDIAVGNYCWIDLV